VGQNRQVDNFTTKNGGRGKVKVRCHISSQGRGQREAKESPSGIVTGRRQRVRKKKVKGKEPDEAHKEPGMHNTPVPQIEDPKKKGRSKTTKNGVSVQNIKIAS